MVEPLYQSPSFDGVLPSLAFLQVFMWTFPRLVISEWRRGQWINWACRAEFLDTIVCLLTSVILWETKVNSCCAEPSLRSCGARARASSRRTDLGYVCRPRREDLPHRCPHGGSGTCSAADVSRCRDYSLSLFFCFFSILQLHGSKCGNTGYIKSNFLFFTHCRWF